jgi:ribosomal protein S10
MQDQYHMIVHSRMIHLNKYKVYSLSFLSLRRGIIIIGIRMTVSVCMKFKIWKNNTYLT